ncbi:hypothetical protein [Undibacterium sp. Xuan67W]|uniref:hypothetical protein n=1 Tax=Undibacterium sp. Xuan67W TaxID=3413057 RepID=UPI003BF068F8
MNPDVAGITGLLQAELALVDQCLLDLIADQPAKYKTQAAMLELIIDNRLILSSNQWSTVLSECADSHLARLASATQHAGIARIGLSAGDCAKAFKSLVQAVFEAGEAHGTINAIREKALSAARARHTDDAKEELLARTEWETHIKHAVPKFTQDQAAARLAPVVFSTAKSYLRKWRKEEKEIDSAKKQWAAFRANNPDLALMFPDL